MAPYLTCDSYSTTPQPTEFEVYMDGAAIPVISPAKTDATGAYLWYDLATIPNGHHSVMAKAALIDPNWGRLVSNPSSPFAFERPSAPVAPLNIRLKSS